MHRLLLSVLLVMILSVSFVSADVVTTTLDASYGQYINKWNAWPTSAGGQLYMLEASATAPKQLLIQFDLSSIPSNAQIVSAEFTVPFHWFSGTAGTYEANVYRVTGEWVCSAPDADPIVKVLWDSRPAVSISDAITAVASAPVAGSWVSDGSINVSTDVKNYAQGWVNGSFSNNGLLVAVDNYTSGVSFQHGYDPQLVVSYDVVPEPATLSLVMIGGIMSLRRRYK